MDGGEIAGRRRESGPELEQAADLGAAEAVDGLVGVADHDEVTAVPGDRGQQPLLGGVGVLVLVDHDEVEAGAQRRPPGRGLGVDDGAVHQLGVVEGAELVEHGQVVVEEARRRGPVGPAPGLRRHPGEVRRLEAEAPGPGEQRADLVGEAARAQGDAEVVGPVAAPVGPVACEHVAHDDVLLGPGQQPQRASEVLQRPGLPREGVGEGVEGPRRLGLDGASEARRDAVAQLLGGAAGEREGEDAVGRGSGLHPTGDRLDEGGGLAGAGTGQHEQGSVAGLGHCVGDSLLSVVEDDPADGRQRA